MTSWSRFSEVTAIVVTLAAVGLVAGGLAAQAVAATGAMTTVANDAAVTAGINAALARDRELGALRIDVDTHGGRVLLSGTAPNAQARERATVLSQSVQGVVSVDNRLVVQG